MTCNEFEVLHAEVRIAKLSAKPVENAKLIKKWERKLRKATEKMLREGF